tara:strand:+ start:2584 stop:3855 length:1272 start_codon:yes stop_codon:yes gene_type:complete
VNIKDIKICVVGLGYVGLPLALEFSKKFKVIGYDVNHKRIKTLKNNKDYNKETDIFYNFKNLIFTDKTNEVNGCNFYIISVPTPINKKNKPDISLLKKASAFVGGLIKKNDIVVIESTVYPGCTRNDCVPLISSTSKLSPNKDFFYGYSPERINPGDKVHTLRTITKVISGSNKKTLKKIQFIYSKIIKAGLHIAPSIEVAEAAKVIENTQRDLNIAFMNELSIIFNKLKIPMKEVLKASSTKWNFLNFKPGLVGGHCIGVDPYYLSHVAKENNYNPNFLISGREINNNMTKYISKLILKVCRQKKLEKKNIKLLILGLTFKENVSDLRNSKILNLVEILQSNFRKISIYDPEISSEDLEDKFKKIFLNKEPNKLEKYNLIIYAVAHKKFNNLVNKIYRFKSDKNIIVDLTLKLKNEFIDIGF